MRLFGLLAALFLCTGLGAQEREVPVDWHDLNGSEIKQALTGATLDYANAWQDFRASGKTLYNAGADSWGNWRVVDDQYCSQWPPRDLWDCYYVAQSGILIRFLGKHGETTIGRLLK